MAFEIFVSLRHLKAKREQKFISLNTWISIGGVALGVMALIVVIAVMSGFGKDLRDKILGTNSHIVVTNITQSGMDNFEFVLKKVMEVKGVKAAAPFILNQVMLTFGDHSSGVVIRGVDPNREVMVSDLEKNMVRGEIGVLKKNKNVTVFNGNEKFNSVIHIKQLFYLIDKLINLKKKIVGTFNFAPKKGEKLKNIVLYLKKCFGSNSKIRFIKSNQISPYISSQKIFNHLKLNLPTTMSIIKGAFNKK